MSENANIQAEIEEIEISLEEARAVEKEMKDLLTLTDNPIFARIILKGYFKEYSLNLLGLASSLGVPDREREQINIDMHGPAALKRYLEGIIQKGRTAQIAISNSEDQIEQLQDELDPFSKEDEGDDA